MSQVHDDLDAALSAFRTAFPSSKPRVTVSYVEKEVQLLLHEPENPSTSDPRGMPRRRPSKRPQSRSARTSPSTS